MDNKSEKLILNLDKLHTTKMGVERIKKNVNLDSLFEHDDVVKWCIENIKDKNSYIYLKGKNWYVEIDEYKITVNSYSYTIITAHKILKSL